MNTIEQIILESIKVKEKILSNNEIINTINTAADLCINAFKQNNKVLFCGNGGSAADAQHLAAELSGRFEKDRNPLYSEALHVNSSYITAVSNDYGFNNVYSRMIKAIGNKGDVLIGLSTSGNSENIINAFNEAKILNIKTIAFTGSTGGKLKNIADLIIRVPSDNTARIQEAHITIGHAICKIIEDKIF